MGKFTFQPWLGRDAASGVFCKGCIETKGVRMAPQLGHVSNFCRLKTGPLEPDQRADGIWDSGWENG